MTNTLPLHIDMVSKRFEQHIVLKSIGFSVNPGEIFGLIGLNGAGKTTLIKIILDLLKADNGKVQFFGEDATTPKSRRHIAYLPEKFTPSTFLKGKEFLSLAASHTAHEYDENEARKYATSLGLNPETLENRVGKYSKGMGQKLGLMSMFMSKAPLLILDEPMSGLDPSARIQLKDLLTLYSKAGNAIFFSSHILADIDEICDRIAVLHDGAIMFVGTVEEFKQTYGNDSLERTFLRSIGQIA